MSEQMCEQRRERRRARQAAEGRLAAAVCLSGACFLILVLI